MVRPKNGLDPASQPWARDIESSLDSLATGADQLKSYVGLTLNSINSTLKRLGDTLNEVAAQQSTLTAQQTALADQLAAINDLIGAQVYIASVGGSDTGFTLNTSTTLAGTQSITVPSGFTRAIVHVTTDLSAVNNSGGVAYMYCAGSIAGIAGGQSFTLVSAGSGESTAASAIRSLTGLSGGTISVGASVNTGSGSWTSTRQVNVNAIAVFLR